jgi:hypothetical protein
MSNPSNFTQQFEARKQLIRSAMSNQEKTMDELKKEYLENKKTGIYNYVTEIPYKNVFGYFFMFLFIFYILDLINFSLKNIIVLIGTTLIIFFLNEKRRSTTLTRMEELQLKLNGIYPKPKFFHNDSGIIELLFSMKEYKIYNVISYNRLIRTLDDFLSIIVDIEKNPKQAYKMYDTLKLMKNTALNLLHSIIFNIPSNLIAENKLNKALDSLQFILQIHLEKVKKIANQQYLKTGPKTDNGYIPYDEIEFSDPQSDSHINRSSAYENHYDRY